MFDLKKFKALMVIKGETTASLARKMNLDESTLYRKIKANGAFTREEMGQLIEILDITDPMSIFFADELEETQEVG